MVLAQIHRESHSQLYYHEMSKVRVVCPVASQPQCEHHPAAGDHGQVDQDEDHQHHLGHLLLRAEAARAFSGVAFSGIYRDD